MTKTFWSKSKIICEKLQISITTLDAQKHNIIQTCSYEVFLETFFGCLKNPG